MYKMAVNGFWHLISLNTLKYKIRGMPLTSLFYNSSTLYLALSINSYISLFANHLSTYTCMLTVECNYLQNW